MAPLDELAVELLRRGRSLRIKAHGASMLPFLRDGDIVLINPARRAAGVGDIVCYESTGRLFLHRVLGRAGDRVVTKGDALSFTEAIDPTQVLGTAVAIERRGGLKRLDTRAARWRNRRLASLSHLVPPLLAVAIPLRRTLRTALHG